MTPPPLDPVHIERPEPAGPSTSSARLWESYFAVVLAAVIVFILMVDGVAAAQRLAVTGILLAMAVWYLLLGRRGVIGVDPMPWRPYVFEAGLLALFAAAMMLMDSATFILFAVCPAAYMALPLRAAHAVVAAFALTPTATYLAAGGDVAHLRMLLPMGAIIFTVSAVIAIIIERVARQSAERAALIEELESTRAEVARLSREAGVAEERQRVAGDLHDTVAQGLSSVVMLVQAADAALAADTDTARRHLSMAARTARESLDETRAIVGALTPASLTGASLAEALRRLGGRVRHEAGIAVAFAVEGTPRPLATGVEVVLLRVAQEALNNVRKHSGADDASLRLAFADGSVVLEVGDCGCGFDPADLPGGYGLGAMRTRVEQIGGRLVVHSGLGLGTSVRTEIEA